MSNLNKEEIMKSMMDNTISDITNKIMNELEKAQSRALIYSIIDIYFKEYSYEEYYRKYNEHNNNIDKINNPSFNYAGNISEINYISKYPILNEDEFNFISVVRRHNEFKKHSRGDNNE